MFAKHFNRLLSFRKARPGAHSLWTRLLADFGQAGM